MLPDFNDEFASVADWARMYRAVGLQAVPAKSPKHDGPNYKRPAVEWKEFEDALIPEATIDRWYGQGGEHRQRTNLGIITGHCSGGVFCVDLDVKDGSQADAWWHGLLELHNSGLPVETPWQRTGGGGRQFLFRAPHGWVPPTFKTPIGIDIRGQGGFMMAPPSMHMSGKCYEWAPGAAPYDIEIEQAPDWLIEAIEKVREDHGGSPTGEARERVASSDERSPFGMRMDGREADLQARVWAAVCDLYRDCPIKPSEAEQEAERDRIWTQYLTTTKSRHGKPGLSNADLLELEGRGRSELDRKWRYAMKKWDKEVAKAAAIPKERQPHGNAAPDPPSEPLTPDSVLFDPWERYLAPRFPVGVLPPALAEFVAYRAKSTGGDISAVAMASLAACSGALSQGFSLKMKRSGDWYCRPRLWVCLVGDPSAKKTPIVSGCTAPLRKFEAVGVERYQGAVARWKDEPKDERGDEPERPTRYIVNDTTSEKLGEILSRQDRGALMDVDELSGWIGSMDKYSGGKGSAADRAFWLTAYNGGPKTIDRLSRGETYIKNLCVAFVGGIQPERLKSLTDLTSDGLLQRFLPVMMRKASYPQEVEDDAPAARYDDLINALITLTPARLQFDEGALAVCDELQRFLFDLENTPGLGSNFCSFVGKLGGVHGSISLLLHMVENPAESIFDRVPERVARAASRVVTEFIIPHALELYRATGDSSDMDGLRQLASFVLTSEKDRFTPSDFTTGVRSMRGLGTWELAQKVSPLVAGGWLSEDQKGWIVVPGLRELLAERRQKEQARKAETLKMLRKITDGEAE